MTTTQCPDGMCTLGPREALRDRTDFAYAMISTCTVCGWRYREDLTWLAAFGGTRWWPPKEEAAATPGEDGA